MSALDQIAEELERTAERLRAGKLSPEEAAPLVERCADLAASLASELEREARAIPAEAHPAQERLH